MGEVEENRGREHVTMQMNSFPRDLFQGFVSGSHFLGKFQGRADDGAEDKDEDIELTLGLSLNGRFGVDPERAKKLTRSSSISNFMISNDHNKACMGGGAYVPLTRTCSLPTETEEEWRKRKELQSLRRMEAKRKRMEKLKNVRVVRDKVDLEENGEFNGGQGLVTHNGNGFGVPPQLLSQRSGASVIFDFDCQLIKDPESGSPSSVHSLPGRTEQIAKAIPVASNGRISTAGMENPSINLTDSADKEAKQMLRNVMIDMPCVSTKGDGPNGKRIEGFLYRYRKGEEARIVCVCHGSFLSPAEFVRHAGGGDVAHPLKHIVVNPSPFL